MLISEAFELYRKAEIVAGGLSKKTWESYLYTGKLAVAFFGDVPIENIQAEDVMNFHYHLTAWQKPDTVRGNIMRLRSVLRLCQRKKIKVMDVNDIKIPKREKRQITYLTPAEIQEFIEVVKQPKRGYAKINRLRNIAMLEILWSSGIRVSELCKLNRNSIKNRQFTVVGKSFSPRIVFITERAERAIKDYLKYRTDDNNALFISNQNERRITPGAVRRIFRCICEKSDFEKIHPHTFRHSFATMLLDREVDIRYIADLLGHESLDTTRVYTHYTNPKLKLIYERATSSY